MGTSFVTAKASRAPGGSDVIGMLKRYAHWLHGQWPTGRVEPLPVVGPDGRTNVPGLFVVGDLTGVPLLKFALDSGARAASATAAEPRAAGDPELDLAIVGGGVAGMAAALEARRLGLRFRVIEAASTFFTIENFPRRKPIFTYPMAMTPAGTLQVSATVKEALLDELRAQCADVEVHPGRAERVSRAERGLLVHLAGGITVAARRVIVAIGRSGDFRRLGAPGEELAKVSNRLHDPAEHAGRHVLVVGGGDSALEAAVALADAGALVTLAHRGREFARARAENAAALASRTAAAVAPGRVHVRLETTLRAIHDDAVELASGGAPERIPNDAVFALIGREAPLAFFRRSGVPITGEMRAPQWAGLAAFVAFCTWLYNWKSGGFFTKLWYERHWFPTNLPDLLAATGGAIAAQAKDPGTLLGALAISAAGPSFWYTLAYSIVIVIFGARRIARRNTPYITAQTLTLMAVQVLPLFLLPEVLLPLMGRHGWIPAGVADALFPAVTYGHGREYWRAYGFVLAFPLNVYNLYTHQPLPAWIAISIVQTLVLIPLGVRAFGKGFYCGWICSCGALAETLGDDHRHKMPHGPQWNRANLAGQVLLAISLVLLAVRIVGWVIPGDDAVSRVFQDVLEPRWKWWVDVGLAGILGYGVYFWFSGRVWCRFLCPLAALMHVYARGSKFAIVSEKKKCISCAQCTSVCHMGIDVMNFANRGRAMQDPECVRCSACVHACPTGVLQFGTVAADGAIVSVDSLMASPVKMREGR